MAAQLDPRLIRFRECHLADIVRDFSPEAVIAFGSRVRGNALKHSDLDLIVVARAFENVPFIDRGVQVLTAIGAPFAMDVLCYTPEEFERKRNEIGIVRTAIAEGIDLIG